jgi:hypothetical protein
MRILIWSWCYWDCWKLLFLRSRNKWHWNWGAWRWKQVQRTWFTRHGRGYWWWRWMSCRRVSTRHNRIRRGGIMKDNKIWDGRGGLHTRRRKRKYILIKTSMSSDKNSMRNRIKTSKTFVGSVVTKKNARKTSWFKLMLGIITQVWKT